MFAREQIPQRLTWREGARGKLKSHFAAFRVRAARLVFLLSEPRMLLIEWPAGESKPIKYWLSTLPRKTSLKKLVYFAKLR